MRKFKEYYFNPRNLLLLLFVFFIVGPVSAQDSSHEESASYQGEKYAYYMTAPEDWIVDFENAEGDSYSIAFYPDSESYFDYTAKIRIGIFKNGKRTFEKFVSEDSVYLHKRTENLEIIRSDSLIYSSGNEAILFETEDPGGEYELAMVAYIDLMTEIVVYELLVSSREHFGEAEDKFQQALSLFSIDKAK